MANGVVIKNRVAAMNVDSYNRSAVTGSGVDIQINNGYIFRLDAQSGSSGYEEVWAVEKCNANASTLNNMWMAYSPEIVITTSGNSQYKGIDVDPRNFTNIGGKVFDAFKLQAGDVITMTAADISGSPSTGDYVNSTSGSYTFTWAASATADSLAMRLLKETYISIGSGAIDTQRVLAYKFAVVAN